MTSTHPSLRCHNTTRRTGQTRQGRSSVILADHQAGENRRSIRRRVRLAARDNLVERANLDEPDAPMLAFADEDRPVVAVDRKPN